MISTMARKTYTDEFRRQAVDLYEQTEGGQVHGRGVPCGGDQVIRWGGG